jgi:hypothetical protein
MTIGIIASTQGDDADINPPKKTVPTAIKG